MRIIHPIPAIFNSNSRILILGSFPSVKSREAMFFYGHKQNRFWKLTAELFNDEIPSTTEEKKDFLYRHNIAVWDVIAECDIEGSSDSSIKNVIPNDLTQIIDLCPNIRIFCNGNKSYELYCKYIEPVINRPAIRLPSTSPANAAMNIERLKEIWKQIL